MKKNETVLMYHESSDPHHQSAVSFDLAWSYVGARKFCTERATYNDDIKYIGVTTYDLAEKFIEEVHKLYKTKYPRKGNARPSAEEILTLWIQFNIKNNLLEEA